MTPDHNPIYEDIYDWISKRAGWLIVLALIIGYLTTTKPADVKREVQTLQIQVDELTIGQKQLNNRITLLTDTVIKQNTPNP